MSRSGYDDLEVYLSPAGAIPGIGPEKGRTPRGGDGIAKYTSPHGSTRYVAYQGGVAVAALQVVSRDGRTARTANVYTIPEGRRQGWASRLLARARKDFERVEQAPSEHRSAEGDAWARAANPRAVPLDTIDVDGMVEALAQKAVEATQGQTTVGLDGAFIGNVFDETLDVAGRRQRFVVQAWFRHRPQSEAYTLSAGGGLNEDGLFVINLYLNSREGARLRIPLRSGELQASMKRVLEHELAHARTYRAMRRKPGWEVDETGRIKGGYTGLLKYYNDPLEVPAFTQTVAGEARAAARRLRGTVGDRRLIERAFEESPTWQHIERYLFTETRARMTRAVVREIEEELAE